MKRTAKRNAKLSGAVTAIPVQGMPEVSPGDRIAELLLSALANTGMALGTGDIIVLKHKIVAKAEGRIVQLASVKPSRAAATFARKNKLDSRVIELGLRESRRVLRRKHVLITETQQGFVCANSGVDVSNVDGGESAVLLPVDPDKSAARVARALQKKLGFAVPVIIADSFGRAWRNGLCDVAIGVSGLEPLHDYRGRRDDHGYTLHATEEAVADELAAMAGLVCGKDTRVPACIIRGYSYRRGSGSARQLVRPAEKDLFR